MSKRHNPIIDPADWRTMFKDIFSYDPSTDIVDIQLDLNEGKYRTRTEHSDGRIVEDEYLSLIKPALNAHNEELKKYGRIERAVLFKTPRCEINLNVYLYERLDVNTSFKSYTL